MQTMMGLFLKGMLLGLAAMMPGLTVATTAFVLGSYQQILQSLKSLNLTALKYLFAGRMRELGEYVSWKLLLMLPLGAACAILLLPHFLPLSTWMELYRPHIYAGFCGAIFGGLAMTLWSHRGGGLIGILLFFGGIAASIALLLIPIRPLPGNWEFLFIHGIITVFTEGIPGLANCFAERPLADYNAVAYYADQGYWPALLLFGAGLLIGLILLVSMVSFAYRKASEKTLALLMGLTAGVIMQLWPLRYLGDLPESELPIVGAAFLGGIAFSGLLQFLQRRTLA